MDSVPVRRECREGGEAGDTGSLGNVNVEIRKVPPERAPDTREVSETQTVTQSRVQKISRSENRARAQTHVTVCTVYYWSTHTYAHPTSCTC